MVEGFKVGAEVRVALDEVGGLGRSSRTSSFAADIDYG